MIKVTEEEKNASRKKLIRNVSITSASLVTVLFLATLDYLSGPYLSFLIFCAVTWLINDAIALYFYKYPLVLFWEVIAKTIFFLDSNCYHNPNKTI